MNDRKIIGWLIVVSAAWTVLLFFGLCQPDPNHSYACTGTWISQIGDISQLLFFMPLEILVFSTILFFREKASPLWLRFVLVWFPFSILLVFLAPDNYSGIVGFDKELVSWWMCGIFFVVSLLIIIWKSFSSRTKSV